MSPEPSATHLGQSEQSYSTIEDALDKELAEVHSAMMALHNAVGIEDRRDEESLHDWGSALSATGRLEDAVERLRKTVRNEMQQLDAKVYPDE